MLTQARVDIGHSPRTHFSSDCPRLLMAASSAGFGVRSDKGTMTSPSSGRKKTGVLNDVQQHIRQRAGTWDGPISAKDLLHRTRP